MVDENRAADDAGRYFALHAAVRAYGPMDSDFEAGLRKELALVERLAVAIRCVLVHEHAFQQTLGGDSFDA